jgi:hypothetical protein
MEPRPSSRIDGEALQEISQNDERGLEILGAIVAIEFDKVVPDPGMLSEPPRCICSAP